MQALQSLLSSSFAPHAVGSAKWGFTQIGTQGKEAHERIQGRQRGTDETSPKFRYIQYFVPCLRHIETVRFQEVCSVACNLSGGIDGKSPLVSFEEVALITRANTLALEFLELGRCEVLIKGKKTFSLRNLPHVRMIDDHQIRSEERRVGKECRCRE